jgi:PASTA domain
MKLMNWRVLRGALLCLVSGMVLVACGGGGGGGSGSGSTSTSTPPPPPPPPQAVTISGTVAAGSALTGSVSVYDSSSKSQPIIGSSAIGAGGQYSVTVTGFTAPFLLLATGQVGGQGPTVTLYSVATAAGTVNITPITTLMAMNMAAGNVQTLMTGSTGGLPGLTAADLTAQNTGMDTLLSSVLTAEGLSATYNFSTTTFAVDGTGYSQLLNAVTVILTAPAAVTITNNAVPGTPITIDTQKGSPNGPLDVVSGPATLPVGGVTIGGTITGLTALGLQLQNNGADTISIAANATSFTFATAIASGAAYAVSVKTQPSGQSCAVANGTGTAGSSSVTNVTVACTSNPASTYTVGGTISGLTASGLQLVDNGVDTISVAPNATSFTFATAVASGARYAVTVKTQPSGQSCVVSNGTGTAASSNVTNITVACTTNSASTYTVSGTISGLTGAPLILELNGSEDLTFGAGATTFSFATHLKPSSIYQVTVKTTPVGQVSCSVANGSGTIANSDIVNVAVTCAPFYIFSGTVSNLKGATLILILQNNGGYGSNVVPVLPGQTAFSFGVGVPNGTGYNVTVQQQPSGQSCTIVNGSGTVSGSNVSSITVSCATVSQWAWISGDDSNLDPVYGTLGQGAAGNTPGSRRYAATWSDPQGQLWLFGGSLNASDPGSAGNDLWMFSPATGLWTWMSGSNTANASGIYGTQGIAANSNVPGARTGSATWTDASGALWLFGGMGFDSQGTQDLLNDLWMYDTNIHQWTWVSGYNVVDNIGVYGTLGVPAPANVPSGRDVATTWLDKAGNLWLFGGGNCCTLVGSIYEYYDLNDVWRFNPTSGEWTWMAGSQSPNAAGVFGTRGVADPANTPQARHGAQAWTDAAGNFWLFGGQDTIYSAANSFSGTAYLFNDLWKYDTAINQWTWVGGPQTPNGLGSYGTQGVAAASNVPGARVAAANWTDLSGAFWLLGGTGYDSANTSPNVQNDVWKFDSAANEWTWVSGANADGGGDPGLYQVQGLLAAGNSPGARGEAMSWSDAAGFWLYGGYGATLLPSGATSYSILARGTNELWHFGAAIFYNGTGSMTGTFTDQNGCKYPAPATITNANVTMSTESAGAVTITYTVPALAPAASTCPSYGANSGTFSVPVTVNGTIMQGLSGSIGSVSATISNGVVSGTVGFQETGPQGSGTFSWTESGSFSTVAVPVTVANFVGGTEAAAVAAISNAGLTIGAVTLENSSTVPAGDVISQTPAPNTAATTGSVVTLVISTGTGGASGSPTTTQIAIDPSVSSATAGSIAQFVTLIGTAPPGSPVSVDYSAGESLLLALDSNGNVVMAALVNSAKTTLDAASTALALAHLLVVGNPSVPSASSIDSAITADPAYQTLLAGIAGDLTTGKSLMADAAVVQELVQVAVDVDGQFAIASNDTHLRAGVKTAGTTYASGLPVTIIAGAAGLSESLFVGSVISQKIDVKNFTPIPWSVATSLASGGSLSPSAPIADFSDAQLTMANSEFVITAAQDDSSYSTLVDEVVLGDLQNLLNFLPGGGCAKAALKSPIQKLLGTLAQGGGSAALMNAVSSVFTAQNLLQLGKSSKCSPLENAGPLGVGVIKLLSLVSKVQAAVNLLGATGQVVYYDLHSNDAPVTIGLCGTIDWQVKSCAAQFAFTPNSLLLAPGAVATASISATDASDMPTGVPGNIIVMTSDPNSAILPGASGTSSYSPSSTIISIQGGSSTGSSPASVSIKDPVSGAISSPALPVSVVTPVISPAVQTAMVPGTSQASPSVSFKLTDANGNAVLAPQVVWQPNTSTANISPNETTGGLAIFYIPSTATPGTTINITASNPSNGDQYLAQNGQPAQLILTASFAGTVQGTLPLTGFAFACSPGPTCATNDVTFGVTIDEDGNVRNFPINQDGNWFITNCIACSPFGTFYDWTLASGTLTPCAPAAPAPCQSGGAILQLNYSEPATSQDGLDYCNFSIVLTPGATGVTPTAEQGSVCNYVGKGVQATLNTPTGPPAITFTPSSQ